MSLATIYIASSWKNQHAVEMLTDLLEGRGYEVLCFVRYSTEERDASNLDEWLKTDNAATCFAYDTTSVTGADVVVYIGPSGIDAWAEVGAAWASQVPIVGLWAKGEQVGLMRYMIGDWFTDYKQALNKIDEILGKNSGTS